MGSQYFSVFVGHLAKETDKRYLKHLFDQCGDVRDVHIAKAKEDQEWTYGFVRFLTLEEALKAVKEMDGWRFKDRRLIVELTKKVNKSSLDCVSKGTISLPAVDPSVKISDPKASTNLMEKIANRNRLQDICSMLNYESETNDFIYINKILQLIEERIFSEKIPSQDLQPSLEANRTLTSGGQEYISCLPPSAGKEFLKKYTEVSQMTQRLLSKGSPSDKPADGKGKSVPRNSSPKKGKTEISPKGKPPSDPLSRRSNVPFQGGHTNRGKDECSVTEKSMVSEDRNVINLGDSLLKKGSVSCENLSSSKLSMLSSTCSKASDSLPRNEMRLNSQNSAKKFLVSVTIGNVECDNEFLSSVDNKGDDSPCEELWQEKKTTQRKKRSEWTSELFFQILSDNSDSSTSADDRSLSEQCSEKSGSTKFTSLPPTLRQSKSQKQFTRRD